LADPWNQTGSGRMRRDRDMPSSAKVPTRPNAASWEYPSSNQYDELNVQELLHGLEAESANAQTARHERAEFSSREQSVPETVCHACQRKNPSGQRFCGYCGTKLVETEIPVREKAREAWPFAPAADLENRQADDRYVDNDDVDIRADQEGDIPRAWPGGPGLDRDQPGSRHSSAREDELQFLRHTVGSDSEESARRKWMVGLTVLVLAVAGFGGYHWLQSTREPVAKYSAAPLPPETQETPEDSSDAQLPGTAQSQAAQAAPQAETKADASAAESGNSPPKSASKAEASGDSGSAQTAPAHLSVAGTPPASQAPTASQGEPAGESEEDQTTQEGKTEQSRPAETAPAEGGQQELTTAERYLSGADGVRDSGEAAKWLWRAVGKQNGRAILLLSGLYAKGDGVSKNCDQARLLLLTAVRKKVPDSVEGLQKLELNGCQ